MIDAASPGLVERDSELAELGALVVAVTRREGALVLLEGPAGIGKTVLVRAARERAREREMTVLSATGSLLDRDFPFGVVHQLLDPLLAGADEERRARLLSGTAAVAEPVVLGGAGVAPAATDPGHAVLHGLYWLLANLAEETPLLLAIDDLHWCDRPSLRLLEFVSRRLEGLPILVLAATRAGEPGAEEDLLAALGAGPAARVIRPGPLSTGAVGRLLAATLGDEPSGEFTDAAASATGGNPLLLRELARAAAERGLRGAAAEAGDVAGIGATGIAGHVRRRLAALGPDAIAVAQAAALLERARTDDLAALSGLRETAAAAAGDRLVQAGVLAAGEDDGRTGASAARSFVHPLVREAIAAEIPPARRSALHLAAARRQHERGARADEVASHLLPTEPANDPWVVEVLRAAAATVSAEGVPEEAQPHLRRALAEPPAPAQRAEILYELGAVEAAAGRADSFAHLTEALEAGLAADRRPLARMLRARHQLYRDPAAAFEELQTALDEAAGDPPTLVRIEALMLDATMYDLAAHDRRAALLSRPGEPSAARLVHLAVEAGYTPTHRDEVAGHAQSVLAASQQLGAETLHLMVQALRNVELRDMAAEVNDAMDVAARRSGSRYGRFVTDHSWAFWHWFFGSLSAAEAHARAALAASEEAGLPFGQVACACILAEVLRERGALDEAETVLGNVAVDDAMLASVVGADFLSARGLVRRLRGRREEAESDLRRAHELLCARGWRNPLKGRAALRLGELLAEQGSLDEARALADGEVATCARAGLRGGRGMALRVAARTAVDPAAGERLLREAIAELDASPLALEQAWARHDLGALLRRSGRRTEARDELRIALDLAERRGAGELAALARGELLQAGARPRRTAVSGPESLTPSERRVAEFAARGLSNREIAETLWVSRKTVEVHLGHAYGKLGIRSRAELAAVLV